MAVAVTARPDGRPPQPPARARVLRRVGLVVAAAAGAVLVGGSIGSIGSIALLGGSTGGTTPGHAVARAHASAPVVRAGAATTTGCPTATTLDAAWNSAHVGAADGVGAVRCDDSWAVAAVTTNGYTTTGLFRLQDGAWQWTDRTTPCSTRQVPPALEQPACDSN